MIRIRDPSFPGRSSKKFDAATIPSVSLAALEDGFELAIPVRNTDTGIPREATNVDCAKIEVVPRRIR